MGVIAFKSELSLLDVPTQFAARPLTPKTGPQLVDFLVRCYPDTGALASARGSGFF